MHLTRGVKVLFVVALLAPMTAFLFPTSIAGGGTAPPPPQNQNDPSAADPQLTKRGPASVAVNQEFSYELDVHNPAGRRGALGVQVSDQLPAGIEFVRAGSDCTHSNGIVNCLFGYVQGGLTLNRTIIVRATRAGTFTNTAVVRSDSPDADGSNNRSSVNTTAGTPGGTPQGGGGSQFPPSISAIVCPILKAARAQILATINALIASFPQLSAQLTAVRNAVLATIDALLAQFGCGGSPKAGRAQQSGSTGGTAFGGAGDDPFVGDDDAADHFVGGNGVDVAFGLGGRDRLLGDRGSDILYGNNGNDRLIGGPDLDLIFGGRGNDSINARDGGVDYVSCGRGRDRVTADRSDVIRRDCEVVRR